jgi:N-acetylglucosamine kinase-like BadF-type ATPase
MYFLGVDGGGTKTFAMITDENGQVLATGISGNSNYQINATQAKQNLEHAVLQALTEAGIQREAITSSCFGLAGADRQVDFVNLQQLVGELDIPNYEIHNDALIALKAAVPEFYGITLICGTGTNAIGRDQGGKVVQIGGFGYWYGDYGGGSHLSLEVFRSVIRSWEGRETETVLTDLVLKELNFTSVEEMYHYYLDHPQEFPKTLTPLLFEGAEENDLTALSIIEKQVEELYLSARAVKEKMAEKDKEVPLVLAGSVILKSKDNLLLREFEAYARERDPSFRVLPLTTEPVVGACLLALNLNGVNSVTIKNRMIESLQRKVEEL